MIKISHCTSLDCHSYDCEYCPQCHHSLYFGEGKDKNGKLWKWEFSPVHGPLFLRKDGEPLKDQPASGGHPAWDPFDLWIDKSGWNNL